MHEATRPGMRSAALLLVSTIFLLAGKCSATRVPGVRKLLTNTWSVPTPPLPTYPCRAAAPTVTAWTDIYVNPGFRGSGSNGSQARPFRDLRSAWAAIPQGQLTRGVRVIMSPGTVHREYLWMENRWGSASAPIVFMRAPGATGTVLLAGAIDVRNCTYLYFQDLVFRQSPCPGGCGGDLVHFAASDYIHLIRVKLEGVPGEGGNRETLKVNQVQGMYVEDSDISGAADNAIDFVAVQYGHICRTRIHKANWCVYAKGGSAYLLLDSNDVFDCGESGLSIGQGTGFEYMTPPWLQYEGYGIQVTNNVIRNVWGAGLGVAGGYNVLVAHNSMFRIGNRSHTTEFLFGSRSCDGDSDLPGRCTAHQAAGGWGPVNGESNAAPIPNKNVFFLNNIAVNPTTSPSQWSHFTAPLEPSEGEQTLRPPGLPSPLSVADNLVIAGNVVVNRFPASSGRSIDLGLAACTDDNPTCNAALVAAANSINELTLSFLSNTALTLNANNKAKLAGRQRAIPAFPAWATPLPTPAGFAANLVPFDKSGRPRTAANSIPGAWV